MSGLSQRLKRIRNDLDMTQEQIAKECGISTRTYSSYENEDRNLSLQFLKNLSENYDINLNWLVLGIGTCYLSSNDKKSTIVDYDLKKLEKIRKLISDFVSSAKII